MSTRSFTESHRRGAVGRKVKKEKKAFKTCRLCIALKKEIGKTSADIDVERQSLLKVLLDGHRKACHGRPR